MSSRTDPDPGSRRGLELQPMIHVEAMSAAVAFYEALGAHLEHGNRDGDFALLRLAGTCFSLLAHPPNPVQKEGTVELNFQTSQPLEAVRGLPASTAPNPATATGFARQLQVQTPDGLLIKINKSDFRTPPMP